MTVNLCMNIGLEEKMNKIKYANYDENNHDGTWYCEATSKDIEICIDAETDQEFFICNLCQYTWEKEEKKK